MNHLVCEAKILFLSLYLPHYYRFLLVEKWVRENMAGYFCSVALLLHCVCLLPSHCF